MRRSFPALAVVSIALAGCAGTRVAQQAPPPSPKVVTVTPEPRDAHGALRFFMTQSGKQMTADQFQAWMQRNGVRVASGRPKPVAAKGADGR